MRARSSVENLKNGSSIFPALGRALIVASINFSWSLSLRGGNRSQNWVNLLLHRPRAAVSGVGRQKEKDE